MITMRRRDLWSPRRVVLTAGLALTVAGCAELPSFGEDEVGDSDEGVEPEPPEPPRTRRIVGIPVGAGSLSYEGVGGPERGSLGPTAYLFDSRGLNWIADGPGRQVLVIDDEGQLVERYPLDGLAQRIEDIELSDTHLYVLDMGLERPTVSRVALDEAALNVWESFELPEDLGDLRELTGLRREPDGAI